nr:MAG: hypothetical protein [Caudoviricetes sp.]
MSIYCVYLTIYFGNKLPPFYIGSSSVEKVQNGYKGTVTSKKYCKIWNKEIKEHPNYFKTKIISKHLTRQEATFKENKLQKLLNVVKSTMYINMAVASPNGFFGMEVSGQNNPNYRNLWSTEQKLNASKTHKELRQKNPETYYKLPLSPLKEKNPRWKDGKTTFRDKEGNTVFTSTKDPRVLSKELVGVGTDSNKANLTKSKNPNLKKYEYIILKTPLEETIKLNWNEYQNFFEKHKLNNIITRKKAKGYKILETKINPNFKLNPPKRQPKILQ